MTSRQFFRLALRRWYVVVVGMLLTAVVGAVLVVSMPVVHYVRSTVTVTRHQLNPIRPEGAAINSMAVILAERAGIAAPGSSTSSSDTTLYGEGILDGSRVRIRHVGGQWVTSVPDPTLIVEAVGPTPEIVVERVDTLVEDLSAHLEDLQRDAGAPPHTWMYLRVTPERPVIETVSGNRVRLLLPVVVVGMVVTGVGVRLADRVIPALGRWMTERRGGRGGAGDRTEDSAPSLPRAR